MPLPRRLAPAVLVLAIPLAALPAPAQTAPDAPAPLPGWIPLGFLALLAAVAVTLVLGWSALSRRIVNSLLAIGALTLFLVGLTAGMWYLGQGARAAGGGASGTGWSVYHWLVMGLAALTVAFLLMFVVDSRRQPIVLESHWGGFGGGLGGVRVPSALIYLAAALGFGTMLTVLADRIPRPVVVQESSTLGSGAGARDGVTSTVAAPGAIDTTGPDSLAVAAGGAAAGN